MDKGLSAPPAYTSLPQESSSPQYYPSAGVNTYTPHEQPYMSPPIQQQPTATITSVNVTSTTGRAVPGGCPVCANSSWTGTYSCCAWLLCLFCFWNCGLCCCLCMRKKKCTKCGFKLG